MNRNNGEDLTKFYILRKPGLVPRVCRPMGDDLTANLRDWFKHHPGATIDIARVRLIDGRVSDLWVDDGIEYLQILNDGGWIPERPGNSSAPTPPFQKNPWKDLIEFECGVRNIPFNENSPDDSLGRLFNCYFEMTLEKDMAAEAELVKAAETAYQWLKHLDDIEVTNIELKKFLPTFRAALDKLK